MAQSDALVATLKQLLKAHGMTYARVARGLRMSEANVKRLFASKRFTVARMEAICQLMNLELKDLFETFSDSRQRIEHLTNEQENELVSDHKLLLVAVCVRNRWSAREIVQGYSITETECIRYLARLDRLKLIDLLPGNRIKLRISEDFRWLADGPIQRYFEKQVQNQFLKSGFNGDQHLRLFLTGELKESSVVALLGKIENLAAEFATLHKHDLRSPVTDRRNIGMLVAVRPWEYHAFRELRRPDQ